MKEEETSPGVHVVASIAGAVFALLVLWAKVGFIVGAVKAISMQCGYELPIETHPIQLVFTDAFCAEDPE